MGEVLLMLYLMNYQIFNFKENKIKSICLGANISSLTAIANDFDYGCLYRELKPIWKIKTIY